MAETLIDIHLPKEEKYSLAIAQIESLLAEESNALANISNAIAVLHHSFGWWWTGLYLNNGQELVLGPFQGPLACTRIAYARGVCGAAYTQRTTIIVPNVEEFPGHIACSAASKSEIVVPIFNDDEIIAVLDVDSQYLNTFDTTDKAALEKISQVLAPNIVTCAQLYKAQ